MIKGCWKPTLEDGEYHQFRETTPAVDGLMWYKDLGHHLFGELSMAVIQANELLEDQSQVESGQLSFSYPEGPLGTFVGIYDGHGGPETSRFINSNLFCNIKKLATEQQDISTHLIGNAFAKTDEDFLSLVKRNWLKRPEIATTGSCCLVGIISNGILRVANVGDSRVVLGRIERGTKRIQSVQLSEEHNLSSESIRKELQRQHPYDPNIVIMRQRAWRVKGLIQVSRSIGDAFLKRPEVNKDPLPTKFRVPEPFFKTIIGSEPSITELLLQPEDQFLIFASDGLWEHLTNQEAVEIVQNHPHNGIAKRLIKAALRKAARRREIGYRDLKLLETGVRRHFHDDITVVVLFLDQRLMTTNSSSTNYQPVSIKGAEWGLHLMNPVPYLEGTSTFTEIRYEH